MGITSITITRVVSEKAAQAARAGNHETLDRVVMTFSDGSRSQVLPDTINRDVDLPDGAHRLHVQKGGIIDHGVPKATKEQIKPMLKGIRTGIINMNVKHRTVIDINVST